MKYLLDSNTFIEANNTYYSMIICPGYWQWLLHSNSAQGVASIEFVKAELEKKEDALFEWCKINPHIFLSVSDEQTQKAFIEVANYVNSLDFREALKGDFLSGADPWLIAKAMTTQSTIVTHEQFNLQCKRKILLPNIAQNFGVPFIRTFELLHILEAKFIFQSAIES